MPAVYHSCPSPSNYARGGTYQTSEEALRNAQKAADGFRVGYQVYEVLDGRPRLLGTFRPSADLVETVDLMNTPNRS